MNDEVGPLPVGQHSLFGRAKARPLGTTLQTIAAPSDRERRIGRHRFGFDDPAQFASTFAHLLMPSQRFIRCVFGKSALEKRKSLPRRVSSCENCIIPHSHRLNLATTKQERRGAHQDEKSKLQQTG